MKKNLADLQKDFVNMRNGVFIHFNSATEQFHDSEIEDWDYGITEKNDPRRHEFDPASWNPSELDCEQWAQTALSGKARFAALTAKHHEGFCLWPTATTEHCVRNGAYKQDVVKAYLEAFRKAGITAGLYFSMLDLQHDITEKKCTVRDKEFIKAQLRELLENYGEIPFLIFDGWNAPWGGPRQNDLPFEEVDDFVKGIQPGCLVMNIGCVDSLKDTDVIFFENAYGQSADESFQGPGAAANLYAKTWFWKDAHTSSTLRSAEWAVERVREYNKRNTCFLMNISPNNRGTVDDNLRERFAEFGSLYEEIPPLEEVPEGWMVR